MKIGLTGATGFLGSHIAAELSRAGHDLVVLVRDRDKAERVLRPHGVWPVETVVGDMADRAAVARLLVGCDAAVHAAAVLYGGGEALSANIAGVRNMIDLGIAANLDPVVYISTIAAMFPPPGNVITVDDPVVDMKTMYGQSKSAGERYAREMQAQGRSVVTIYPGGIHGPRDPGPTEATKGLRDRLRFAWFRTTGGMPLVDVRDVAAVVARACVKGRGPRRYMAGGNFLPWMVEAEICERLTGRPVRRLPAPPPVLRAMGTTIDMFKRVVPSFDYPLTREAADFVTLSVPCDSDATLRELEIAFRPAEETLRDAIVWLYEVGEIDAARAGKLAISAGSMTPSGRRW